MDWIKPSIIYIESGLIYNHVWAAANSADRNMIIDNLISDPANYGIYLSQARNNSITGNVVSKTAGWGATAYPLYLTNSSLRNQITHNRFIGKDMYNGVGGTTNKMDNFAI